MRFILSLSYLLLCLSAYAQTTLKYPIFNEKSKRAIYLIFNEFKFNQPSITAGFRVRYETRTEEKWAGTRAYYIEKIKVAKLKSQTRFGVSLMVMKHLFSKMSCFLLVEI